MSIQVVSQGELRNILRSHAEQPSRRGLRYYELPSEISGKFYATLDEQTQEWFEPDPSSMLADPPRVGDPDRGTRSGSYSRFTRMPGSYNAWVVDA